MNTNMRLYVLLLIILAPSWAISANNQSNSVQGSLTCTIKYQQIVEKEEGKAQVYTSFKGKSKTGDKLELTYDFQGLGADSNSDISIYISLKNEGLGDIWFSSIYSAHEDSDNIYLDEEERKIYKRLSNYQSLSSNTFVFEEDRMFFEYGAWSLSLDRYYKNDYDALYVLSFSDYVHIGILDCRTKVDSVTKVFELFRTAGRVKNNWLPKGLKN